MEWTKKKKFEQNMIFFFKHTDPFIHVFRLLLKKISNQNYVKKKKKKKKKKIAFARYIHNCEKDLYDKK